METQLKVGTLLWFAEVGDILIDYSDNQFEVLEILTTSMLLKNLNSKLEFEINIKTLKASIVRIHKGK